MDPSFVGREPQLQALESLLAKTTASLVVISGRRRIGKSRLIEEFARGKRILNFMGLAPTESTTAQNQRDEFSLQLSRQTGLPPIKTDDWSHLFALLANEVKTGQYLVCLDEITWMAHEEPNFLGKLKSMWDLHFKKNPKLIMILCGSVSSWIEKNILSSTGYFGRITLKITLEELSLEHCNKLLNNIGFRGSLYEKFLLLSIMGGIPWYLEQIRPNLNAIKNIRALCFEKDGLLVDEFKYIFHDLFNTKGEFYQHIVEILSEGKAEYATIADKLNYQSSGALSGYLEELITSGFLARDFTWQVKSGKRAKLSKYRLKDNYLRFYLKYIKPKLELIKTHQYENISLTSLPAWDTTMGLQFENLVLNNRKVINKMLGLSPEDIVYANPFFQNKTVKQKGCQIDYLIQTRYHTFYVCEIKFSRDPLGMFIVKEMEEKIARLTTPKNMTCLPVLIHIGGVCEQVKESRYFVKIIDFNDFLHQS
ncbi:MAG: AAA family ATPase [Proteobacteria bacterium]|nr:AAA family ATPase [Pseudomonadota bacterium]